MAKKINDDARGCLQRWSVKLRDRCKFELMLTAAEDAGDAAREMTDRDWGETSEPPTVLTQARKFSSDW